MPNMKVQGLDDFISFINSAFEDSDKLMKQGLYEGAGVFADAVRSEIQNLPVDNGKKKDGELLTGINKVQKQGLLDGLGISKMTEENGSIEVVIGFNGYNKIKTKKYPKGQPNAMIARSVESGSSIMQKHPFVRKTVNRVRKQAVNAVQTKIIAEIEKR